MKATKKQMTDFEVNKSVKYKRELLIDYKPAASKEASINRKNYEN